MVVKGPEPMHRPVRPLNRRRTGYCPGYFTGWIRLICKARSALL